MVINHKYQEGLLHGLTFDFVFVIGLAIFSIAVGFFLTGHTELFSFVLILDLWFLGYHHVVSTYTRLIFDKASFREYKSLVLHLPIAVAASVTLLAVLMEPWVLATIYLYWQWYHYTRQSEGVCKAYGAKSSDKDLGDLTVSRLAFYSVPLAGILHVSARNPTEFLFMSVKTVPVPGWLLNGVDFLAVSVVLYWFLYQVRAWWQGNLSVPYFIYMISHLSVFGVAYLWLQDINYGWITVNIWHNLQYILFVWLFNNRRFKGEIDKEHLVISILSQNGRIWMYLLVCLVLSMSMYGLIECYGVLSLMALTGIPATMAIMIIYQTINFHHYIVDSQIWKLRKKSIRKNLV